MGQEAITRKTISHCGGCKFTSSSLTVVVGQQEHLQQAKRPTSEVQQYTPNAPSFCALAPEVHPGLQMGIHKLY